MGNLITSETDSWYTSRTLWIAFIIFACNLLQSLGVNVPMVAEGSATMGMILTAIFAILRFVTKKPVTG